LKINADNSVIIRWSCPPSHSQEIWETQSWSVRDVIESRRIITESERVTEILQRYENS
jgi:hypothetical protein